jgi:Acetyltransferase (GNAT) family
MTEITPSDTIALTGYLTSDCGAKNHLGPAMVLASTPSGDAKSSPRPAPASPPSGDKKVSPEVRIATRKDEPELIRLLHLMHAEGGLLPLSIYRAQEMFAKAFDRKGGIIAVIGEPGDIEAAIGLIITSFWYSDANHIEEYFCFVRPDRRRSKHAQTLIEFAQRCAAAIEIPLVIGVLSNKRMESKVRLYRRLLGPPSGAVFVTNSPWNALDPSEHDFWRERPSRRGRRKNPPIQAALNAPVQQ